MTEKETAVEMAAADEEEMARWLSSMINYLDLHHPDASKLDEIYDQIRSSSKINVLQTPRYATFSLLVHDHTLRMPLFTATTSAIAN